MFQDDHLLGHARFKCLNQGDGNAENELQRLKLDIVERRPENCRAVENEARELQNQHLSQGLKNLEHQPSDKQISIISEYPIQGPCIKCTEKSCNRACKYTTYRIRVQSVPHTGDLRMYEHSHEPFFASSSMGQNLQTYGIALKHVWQHSKTSSFQGPGNVEHESGLKT